MNPFAFVKRRPIISLFLVVALACGGFLGLSKRRAEYLDLIAKNANQVKGYVVTKYEAYFHKKKEEHEAPHEQHKIVVTRPMKQDVVVTQEYVCQIHSQRYIDVEALENGYLEAIPVREGQAVKKDDVMFKVRPILYQSKLEAKIAEAELAELEYNNNKKLLETNAVSPREVALFKAKLARAMAERKLAEAELNFATIRAPFDGIVDRLHKQEGSLIKEGEMLTTLSDNSIMWVYFNVPEKRYLEYMDELDQGKDSPDIELVLANHNKFPYKGKIGAIEAKFNNETGNIPFRADFTNPPLSNSESIKNGRSPNRLLRHGQTGTVLIHRNLKDAIVIPQRATFENLAKRYVYVVGKDDIVHQREIIIEKELDDIYVISNKPGLDAKIPVLGVDDRIVLEGIRQVHDGEKVEFVLREPADVLKDQKNHAE